jgi:hypothetical protein
MQGEAWQRSVSGERDEPRKVGAIRGERVGAGAALVGQCVEIRFDGHLVAHARGCLAQ